MPAEFELINMLTALERAQKTPGWINFPDDKKLFLAMAESMKQGIDMYAFWNRGTQYVGTGGRTLTDAQREVDSMIREMYP